MSQPLEIETQAAENGNQAPETDKQVQRAAPQPAINPWFKNEQQNTWETPAQSQSAPAQYMPTDAPKQNVEPLPMFVNTPAAQGYLNTAVAPPESVLRSSAPIYEPRGREPVRENQPEPISNVAPDTAEHMQPAIQHQMLLEQQKIAAVQPLPREAPTHVPVVPAPPLTVHNGYAGNATAISNVDEDGKPLTDGFLPSLKILR